MTYKGPRHPRRLERAKILGIQGRLGPERILDIQERLGPRACKCPRHPMELLHLQTLVNYQARPN